ncbi:inositol monophosphatase family protein [Sphingomonas daechungensis]|uniref:inositol monophosphatase family protein n=1 Tax=Sphingomonas daechungensis TaxID=1176646 RepID=UPI003783B102
MDVTPDLIAFAEELAAVARVETLERWASSVAADDKGTGLYDPVTDADREAERAMRDLITSRYPDHGVTGEEWPDQAASGPYSWSLDPVDGTRSFICQLPNWVTLAGLLHSEQAVLGLIDAPCLNELYIGHGSEAWLITGRSRTRIRTSDCTDIADARLSTTDPFLFKDGSEDAFEALRRSVRVTRYGHDGYAYARVAAGSLDLVIEAGLKPHDYNVLVPVIRGAGGVIGDWGGGEDFTDGKIIAAATRELYEEAVRAFEAFA